MKIFLSILLISMNFCTIASAGIKETTGILELGWQIKAKKSNPWALDLNFTGRVGLQKGISASADVKKSF